jgi:hypothetical protein
MAVSFKDREESFFSASHGNAVVVPNTLQKGAASHSVAFTGESHDQSGL